MKVSDKDAAAVRSVLAGDLDRFDRLQEEAGSGSGAGFAALMAMAFINAVRQRFPSGWSAADVIGFVGRVRVRHDAYDLSPTTAEEMLFAALRGVPMTGGFDDSAKGYAQVLVLADLVGGLDEHRLDEFLAKARSQADKWLIELERP